jgi:hypothetical protein
MRLKKYLLFYILYLLGSVAVKAQYLGGSGYGEDNDITSNSLLTGVVPTPTSIQFVTHPINTVAYKNDVAASVYLYGPNNLLLNWSGTITLTIGTNPGSGSLLGATGTTASGGVATFSSLAITAPGTGYTLSASTTGVSATSNPFDVSDNTLLFTVQPISFYITNQTFLIRVSVTDGAGNVLPLATPLVSLSLSTNPGSGTLNGTTTVTAIAGVASYENLSINNSGVGYVLQATTSGTNAVNSNSFSILNQGAYAGGSGDGESNNSLLNNFLYSLWEVSENNRVLSLAALRDALNLRIFNSAVATTSIPQTLRLIKKSDSATYILTPAQAGLFAAISPKSNNQLLIKGDFRSVLIKTSAGQTACTPQASYDQLLWLDRDRIVANVTRCYIDKTLSVLYTGGNGNDWYNSKDGGAIKINSSGMIVETSCY